MHECPLGSITISQKSIDLIYPGWDQGVSTKYAPPNGEERWRMENGEVRTAKEKESRVRIGFAARAGLPTWLFRRYLGYLAVFGRIQCPESGIWIPRVPYRTVRLTARGEVSSTYRLGIVLFSSRRESYCTEYIIQIAKCDVDQPRIPFTIGIGETQRMGLSNGLTELTKPKRPSVPAVEFSALHHVPCLCLEIPGGSATLFWVFLINDSTRSCYSRVALDFVCPWLYGVNDNASSNPASIPWSGFSLPLSCE